MYNEDNELDYYKLIEDIDTMKKIDYDIPEELNSKVDDTLQGLTRSSRWYKYLVAMVAALFFMLFLASNLFPGFRAFAANIPGLGEAVEWLSIVNDEGIQKAVQNGYPNLGPVKIEKDGYIVQFDNVFIDDTSIKISARLVGEDAKGKSLSLDVDEELGGCGISSGEFIREDNVTYMSIGIKPDLDKFNEYLKTHNKIVIKATILKYDDNNDIENKHYLGDMVINYKEDDILYSKQYNIDKVFITDHGDITLKSIIISPTRTVVNLHYGKKNGYYINGLTDIKLVDDKGHEYAQDNVTMGSENIQMFFNDSTYFRTEVKKLSLQFSGYTMAMQEGNELTLPVDIKEPVEIEYMDEIIKVTSVVWNNGTLYIDAELPENESLIIQEIAPVIDSNRSTVGQYHTDDGIEKIDCSYGGIPKLDEYEVELMYPKYKVDLEGKIELVDIN